jgi:hypothetical protein
MDSLSLNEPFIKADKRPCVSHSEGLRECPMRKEDDWERCASESPCVVLGIRKDDCVLGQTRETALEMTAQMSDESELGGRPRHD